MVYHWTLASVLRASRTGEKDKRLVLFSRELGKVTAVARGTAVPEARWSSSFEPFSLIHLRLYDRSHRFTVVESEERVVYVNITTHLDKSLKGMALNQLTECVLQPAFPEPGMFASYVTALTSMNEARSVVEQDTTFLQYALDVLRELGFGLVSLRCDRCGVLLADEPSFSLSENTFHCQRCRDEADVALSRQLSAFLRTGTGSLDGRQAHVGIALALRLLRTASRRLGVENTFDQFAENAATLFREEHTVHMEESPNEL